MKATINSVNKELSFGYRSDWLTAR